MEVFTGVGLNVPPRQRLLTYDIVFGFRHRMIEGLRVRGGPESVSAALSSTRGSGLPKSR